MKFSSLTRLPNKGNDFETLYVRRIATYSKEKKGIEWLLADALLEEGIPKGFVEKTVITRITKDGPGDIKKEYRITDKVSLCDWICDKRENSQSDFDGFLNILSIFDEILEI